MRALRIFFLLSFAALSFLPAIARAAYSSAQLEGLLAPVALYPDEVLQDVLAAAATPDTVNQALAAYPELAERMAQSPQWTADLGNAWRTQPQDVMATVQTLRQRAYASGTLKSDQYQTVESSGSAIAVAPAMPYVYYVPYYDPWVAYGPYWYPAYTPVYWRPWVARPVFVTRVVVRRGPAFVHAAPRPFVSRPFVAPHAVVQPFHRIPESRRQPIVQSRVPPAFPRTAVPHPVARSVPHSPQHVSPHFSHPGWGGHTVARGGGRRS
jgi:hypothetical protein